MLTFEELQRGLRPDGGEYQWGPFHFTIEVQSSEGEFDCTGSILVHGHRLFRVWVRRETSKEARDVILGRFLFYLGDVDPQALYDAGVWLLNQRGNPTGKPAYERVVGRDPLV